MINIEKHTIQLGAGDVDINVLESPSGAPVLALYNSNEEFTPSRSIFMGFDGRESIDGLISILRNIRRTYYPESKKSLLTDTQRFLFHKSI